MKTGAQYENMIDKFDKLNDKLRQLNQRLLSIESWLAALSKDKNLGKSHKFAHDMTHLAEKINPTIEIEHDANSMDRRGP